MGVLGMVGKRRDRQGSGAHVDEEHDARFAGHHDLVTTVARMPNGEVFSGNETVSVQQPFSSVGGE